jgi:hypothetical protein
MVKCNNSMEGGFLSSAYLVSYGGQNQNDIAGTPLAYIILIPLVLAMIFLLGSFFLGEEHTALKIFLFLLSFIPVFIAMNYGTAIVAHYYNFQELQNLMGTHVYWMALLFFTILTYFIIYWLYKIIQFTAEKKKKGLEY